MSRTAASAATVVKAGVARRPVSISFARGTDRIVYDPDGWTIRSADVSRTAHSEHTIAITDGDPLVLTRSAA
jgi:hypothetical protein